VQQTGEVRAGDSLPGLMASQAIVERMLDMAPGQVSDPIPLADRTGGGPGDGDPAVPPPGPSRSHALRSSRISRRSARVRRWPASSVLRAA